MPHDDVRAYYDSFGAREWQRLERINEGWVEFFLTTHTLSTYLPDTAHKFGLVATS
jgi:predicted ester cyclase